MVCSCVRVQDTVSAHGLSCARAPVACPQRCGAGGVARADLAAHLRDHAAAAAAAALPCSFRDAGCRFKVNLATQIYSF